MAGQTIILASSKARLRAQDLIQRAPWNAVVTIKPERRSTEQNAKLWAMISDVSRAKPEGRAHTPEVWKALFMAACGHEVQFEQGLENGSPFPVGFRSSRLTKAQMCDLIDFISAYGARHGVPWSNEPEAA
ncbi:MAG: recombination protein NinB [Pseudomonadota bacterium]